MHRVGTRDCAIVSRRRVEDELRATVAPGIIKVSINKIIKKFNY